MTLDFVLVGKLTLLCEKLMSCHIYCFENVVNYETFSCEKCINSCILYTLCEKNSQVPVPSSRWRGTGVALRKLL